MNKTVFLGFLAYGCLMSQPLLADCSAAQVNNPGSVVRNMTVCGSGGGDTWQEEHLGNRTLFDFKKGPNDPVDPRVQVGTWSARRGSNTRPSFITYNYLSGSTFTFSLRSDDNNTYFFCDGNTLKATATIKPLGNGC